MSFICPQCLTEYHNEIDTCMCGYQFSGKNVWNCPICLKQNSNEMKYCECGYKRDESSYSKNDNPNNTRIKIQCQTCGNILIKEIDKDYDAFVCNKCRAVYLNESTKGEISIKEIIKGNIIPSLIKEALDYFNIDEQGLTIHELNRVWKKSLELYHPDKVSHLGNEFKQLAEIKTKEININHEKILTWLKAKKI